MFRAISRILNYPRATRAQPGERSYFWVPRYEAGKYIDHDSALTFGAVYAAVRVVAETVAALPWPVLRAQRGGGRERLPGHGNAKLLNSRANRDMGAFSWREVALGHALLWGNHYSEIERDAARRPVGLWPLHPGNVEAKRTEAGDLYYEVRQRSGATVSIAAADMFHLHGMGSDGLTGYSVVALAARSIGYGIAAEEFGASFYGNGAQLGGIITQKEGTSVLNADGVVNLLKTFNRKHQGSADAHRVAYLDGGLTYQEIGVKPDDAQFLNSRQFSVTEIARWFRVPPHKLADLERATFSNIEHQSIEFVTDTILPWCVRLEQEANYKLFGTAAPAGMYTKLELKGLLRGDLETRTKYYKEMSNLGAFSINDILELEDRNPIGPEGDTRIVPLNMTTLERMIEGEEMPAAEVSDDAGGQGARQAQAVAALRVMDSHQQRHAQLVRPRYSYEEFFSWRETYMERHAHRMLDAAQMGAYSDWRDTYEHRVKRRLLAVYEGKELPDDVLDVARSYLDSTP